MRVLLKTAPTLEPTTLTELLLHLHQDSDDIATALTTAQSILPGSHAVADNYTTHTGAGVSVLGKTAIVNLNAGTVGEGGTVDAKIQESNDNATWTDWTGGAFTQVKADNDNAIQEKQYTGSMAYTRVVAKVLVAACEFGADILTIGHDTIEDDWLSRAIATARERIEDITSRQLLTATYEYYLDSFPLKNFIRLPYGNLQSVTSVKYKDSDGTEHTMTVTTDYIVETNGEGYGRLVLAYGKSWPSFVPYPSNPITIEFVCGWTAANLLPKRITSACLMICAKLYANRGEDIIGQSVVKDKTAENYLASLRLWEEF
jgi:uncharacterized phiE125 gp8 family phage protein